MTEQVLLTSKLPGVKLFKQGKVRDVYDLGDKLLIVATDRISAFDVVLPEGIPGKGKVLTQLSEFWFNFTLSISGNHLLTTDVASFPKELSSEIKQLQGRSMLVKKVEALPLECVVRGYLAGSGWGEYQEKGTICGIKLPSGLEQAEKLPEPIFTPSTKVESGHDMNISEAEAEEIVGRKRCAEAKEKSLALYEEARKHADACGIIISDTKFEFGILHDELIVIDELLTPDSSRFWDKKFYRVGESPQNFDKQFIRDYLETLDWNKTPPAPFLSSDIIKKTSARYLEAYQKLSGKEIS